MKSVFAESIHEKEITLLTIQQKERIDDDLT